MPTNTKSPFAGVEDADVPGGGKWIEPGIYDLELLEQRYKEGYKGYSYISEFKVLTSENPKQPVGSVVSQVIKIEPLTVTEKEPKGSTKHQMGLGNIKGLLSKALCENEDNITQETVEASVDGQNRLAGTVLNCIAIQIPTLKGGVFTKCTWKYLRGGFVEKQRLEAEAKAKTEAQK